MPCFSPLKAFRDHEGRVGFRQTGSALPFELPCGQCRGCRIERSRQWALRIIHEASLREENCFVTLTYDNEHLPKDGSLDVSHWQTFAKRLRKAIGPFRFFHCGEYGERGLRPHYHACLFGVSFLSDRVLLRSKGRSRLYRSELLDSTWQRGFCSIGELSYQSAGYVASYCVKKLSDDYATARYERYDSETGEVWTVRPEYVTMSRRPGIGSDWFDKYAGDVFPGDELVHEGKRFRPPRFYTSKLPESVLEAVKSARRRKVFAAKASGELAPDRLAIREEILDRRVEQLKRDGVS